MKPKFIERIHLNIPKPLIPKIDDFDNTAVQIINKAVIKAVEQINDAIFNEIVAIARSEGIDDIYLLDKKNIVSALTKQVPMAVRGMQDFCVCQRTVYPRMNYCPGCGQKLDWGKKE